jgi:hypothetical protein
MPRLRNVATVTHKAAGHGKLTIWRNRGNRVVGRQRGNLFRPALKEVVRADHEATNPLFGYSREDLIRCNHVDAPTNQISRQCWQPIVMTFGPPVFNHHIAAFGKTSLTQSGMECRLPAGEGFARTSIEPSDHRHRRLLRPRRKGPRSRAADKADELPPPQDRLPARGLGSKVAHLNPQV